MTFLGYRIGRNYRQDTGAVYIGTRPSPASVQSICRRMSELTTRRSGLLSPEVVVARLNRLLTGWANYFTLGQVSPGLRGGRPARDAAAAPVALSEAQGADRERSALPGHAALVRLRAHAPCTAHDELSVGEGMNLVREPDAGNPHVRFDERRLETEQWRGVRHRRRRKPPGTATPCAYRHRASRRLYEVPAAFERRCIPPDRAVRTDCLQSAVAIMLNMRPPHALSGTGVLCPRAPFSPPGALGTLGATRGSTTGCYACEETRRRPSGRVADSSRQHEGQENW